jgi:hypothetical protein
MAKMDWNQKEIKTDMKTGTDALVSRMDAQRERTQYCREATEACLGKTEARIEVGQEPREADSKTGLEGMKTTDFEANPGETEAVTARQEVPDDEAAIETIGALNDRSGNQRPAVGCRNPLKMPTKDNVVRGTPKGRTFEKRRRRQHKFNNGIIDRGLKQQLRLGGKGSVNETLRQTIVLKVIKLAAGSCIRIPKMSVKTLCRSRPPPKRKKRLPTAGVPEL